MVKQIAGTRNRNAIPTQTRVKRPAPHKVMTRPVTTEDTPTLNAKSVKTVTGMPVINKFNSMKPYGIVS